MAWFSSGPQSPSRHSSRPSPPFPPPGRRRHSSTSHYRRRPRDGYINRLVHQLKKLMYSIYGYAHRHPVKIFMLFIMPLITGGALHRILKRFGVPLPASVSRAMMMMGGGGMANSERSAYGADSYGGGRGNFFGDIGGGMGALQSVMQIAKIFT